MRRQDAEGSQGKGAEEAVVLPMVDARGRAVPGAFGREQAGAGAPEPGEPFERCRTRVP